MANRHLARSTVLQTLFELDFNGFPAGADIADIISRNAKEFAPGAGDFSFMKALVTGVLGKQSDLDTIIAKAAPEWPIEKIAMVDRNILRLGLYELLFADRNEVPAKVAINEAIELAKTFGGDKSSKFINGVLGAVYKEIGEPGKADTGSQKKKTKKEEIPYEKLPQERLAGAVVYARDGEDVYLALVHDVFGHWTLSKGHLEEKETEAVGIRRIISEELGITAEEVEQEIGSNEYVANQPEKGKLRKKVTYYLVRAPFDELTPEQGGGLDDARWFKLADIIDLNFYDDMLPVVTNAVNILLQKSGSNAKEE